MEKSLIQPLIAVFVSFLVATRAYVKKSLDFSGAVAGFFVMTIHIAVGSRFFIYLFYFAKYFDRLGYGFVNNIYLLSEGMGLCCWSSFSLHPSLRRWERTRNDALTPNSKTAVREIGNLFPLLSLINHLFHCRVLKIKLIS